jgi:hypothetical protein
MAYEVDQLIGSDTRSIVTPFQTKNSELNKLPRPVDARKTVEVEKYNAWYLNTGSQRMLRR